LTERALWGGHPVPAHDEVRGHRLEQGALHPRDKTIAELKGFGEIVTGVDVEQRHRVARGCEGFSRQPRHDDGVFAAGEEEDGALELGGDFAKHVNGFAFEHLQMMTQFDVGGYNI